MMPKTASSQKVDEQSLVVETYKMLRAEIEQKTNSQDTLLTFTDTSVVTIIGIITAIKHPLPPEVYWIPLAIIVPMLFRFVYYRESIAKLATYIAYFLEHRLPDYMRWESRQLELDQWSSKKYNHTKIEQSPKKDEVSKGNDKYQKEGKLHFLIRKSPFFKRPQRFYDFLILSLVCCGIYLAQIFPGQTVDCLFILKIIFLLIVEIVIAIVTIDGTNLTKSRWKWHNRWRDLENEKKASKPPIDTSP